MTDIERFKSDLALDKSLQEEVLNVDPESEAIAAFARSLGYRVATQDVEQVLKDLLWLARVGDDIDHA